jgi:hypothetical protein
LLLIVDFLLCTVNSPGVVLLLIPPLLLLDAALLFALKQEVKDNFLI